MVLNGGKHATPLVQLPVLTSLLAVECAAFESTNVVTKVLHISRLRHRMRKRRLLQTGCHDKLERVLTATCAGLPTSLARDRRVHNKALS